MDEKKPLIQVRRPQDRLSESFPPDTQNNFEYIANVHKLLQKVDLQKINIQSRITLRNFVKEEDMEEIKNLHQEWFPLPYHDTYYESILKNQVKSILVEFEISKKEKVIIGCLFYMSKPCKQKYVQFRYKYLFDDYYGVYITTIGVVNSFRSQGIAKIMMDKLKEICLNSALVQYLYLHIVTYNNAGIKYYERNGFKAIERKRDHYSDIEGKQYDAYVYIYYLNNSSIKVGFFNDLFTCLAAPINSIIDLFKSTKKKFLKQKQ